MMADGNMTVKLIHVRTCLAVLWVSRLLRFDEQSVVVHSGHCVLLPKPTHILLRAF